MSSGSLVGFCAVDKKAGWQRDLGEEGHIGPRHRVERWEGCGGCGHSHWVRALGLAFHSCTWQRTWNPESENRVATRAGGSAGLKETLVSGLNSESRAAPAQGHRQGLSTSGL